MLEASAMWKPWFILKWLQSFMGQVSLAVKTSVIWNCIDEGYSMNSEKNDCDL